MSFNEPTNFVGVLKRRSELILPWLMYQVLICKLFAMALLVAYVCPNDFLNRHMGTVYYCRCKCITKILEY